MMLTPTAASSRRPRHANVSCESLEQGLKELAALVLSRSLRSLDFRLRADPTSNAHERAFPSARDTTQPSGRHERGGPFAAPPLDTEGGSDVRPALPSPHDGRRTRDAG